MEIFFFPQWRQWEPPIPKHLDPPGARGSMQKYFHKNAKITEKKYLLPI